MERFSTAIFLAAALAVIILNFTLIAPIVLSFLLIVLISLSLNPLVSRLRRLVGRRGIGTALLVFVFIILLGLAAWAFYTPVSKSASKFMERLPQYWKRVQEPLRHFEQGADLSEPEPPAKGRSSGDSGAAAEPAQHPGRTELVTSLAHALQALISNM